MKTVYSILSVLMMLAGLYGCTPEHHEITPHSQKILEVQAIVPGGPSDLRISLEQENEQSLNMMARWRQDDFIQPIFVQGDKQVRGRQAMIRVSESDSRRCSFTLECPEDIDPTVSYDIYAVSGADVEMIDGVAHIDITPRRGIALKEAKAPVWASIRGVTAGTESVQMSFKHMGCYEVIHLYNLSLQKETLSMVGCGMKAENGEKWYYDVDKSTSETKHPYFNLFNNQIIYRVAPSGTSSKYPHGVAPYDEDTPSTFVTWYVPDSKKIVPDCRLHVGQYSSGHVRQSKGRVFESGRAYHLYSVWGGIDEDHGPNLVLLERELFQDSTPYVEVKLEQGLHTLPLQIDADLQDQPGVWIDLNHNFLRDPDESISKFGIKQSSYYKDHLVFEFEENHTEVIRIYGRIHSLKVANAEYFYMRRQEALKYLDLGYNKVEQDKHHPTFYLNNAPNLETLYCPRGLRPDVSEMLKLRTLTFGGIDHKRLQPIDLSKNVLLERLEMSNVDLSGGSQYFLHLIKLKTLRASDCQLNSIDISTLKQLEGLSLSKNRLTKIDVSDKPNLKFLNLSENELTDLNLSSNTKLALLWIADNALRELSLNHNTELRRLGCSNNPLSGLNLTSLKDLQELYCENTGLKNLDLSQNPKITDLYVSQNELESLDLSKMDELVHFDCFDNPLKNVQWGGLSQLMNIKARACLLSLESLNALYQQLPEITGKLEDWQKSETARWDYSWYVLDLSANPNASDSDVSVAKQKGWLVKTTKSAPPGERPIVPGEPWAHRPDLKTSQAKGKTLSKDRIL